MHYDDITIVEQERTSKTRHMFRQLSREVCGDIYDIPDDNLAIFAFHKLPSKQLLVGGITYQVADKNIKSPGTNFDSEFFHMINFLFVKSDYQGQGIGKKLVNKAVEIMMHDTVRPIRVQSAEKAVGFFEKMGFVTCGEPINSMCGVKLFRFMVNMELSAKSDAS